MTSESDTDLVAAVELLRKEIVPDGMISCLMHEDIISAIRTVLAALPQWQPIETAPKDGTLILLASIGEPEFVCCSGYWTDHNKGGWVRMMPWNPTHWMELPQPPQPPQQQKASDPK